MNTIYDTVPCTVSDEFRESVLVGVIEILAEHQLAEPDAGLPAGLEFRYTRLQVTPEMRAFATDCLLVKVDGQGEVAISHNPDVVLGAHINIDDEGLHAELAQYLGES
jgi:hypothetical protein